MWLFVYEGNVKLADIQCDACPRLGEVITLAGEHQPREVVCIVPAGPRCGVPSYVVTVSKPRVLSGAWHP